MKKLLSILFLLSSPALAIDRPIPCTGNSCKLLFETTGSGGAKVSSGNVDGLGKWTLGPTASTETHSVNGKLKFTEATTFPAELRSGVSGAIVPAGTYDITTPAVNYFGTLSISCNNTGNGNIQTQRLVHVSWQGGAGGPAPSTFSTLNGPGGACGFTVTNPAASIIRITNSSTCTGASNMQCKWHLTSQQVD